MDKVKNPEKGQVIYKDTEIKGFGVRITPTKKSFIIDKRVEGRLYRKKVGDYPETTVFNAREKAIKMLASIGVEEVKEKLGEQKEVSSPVDYITLMEVYENYIESKVLKEKTIRGYKDIFDNHLSQWKDVTLKEITRDMVHDLHVKLSKNKSATANAVMRLLRGIFNYAKAKYRDEQGDTSFDKNPVEIITELKIWNKIKRRQTIITVKDLPVWYKALFELEATTHNNYEVTRDLLVFILFTGLRRGEASRLRWGQLDFRNKTIRIEDTKNSNEHELPLPELLIDLLKRRKNRLLYVFPDMSKKTHIKEPKDFVRKVSELSGIKFTVHDLRRTFITIAESLDIPHYALKRLVNHSEEKDVTAGYIVNDVERLRKPMEKISGYIAGLIKGEK